MVETPLILEGSGTGTQDDIRIHPLSLKQIKAQISHFSSTFTNGKANITPCGSSHTGKWYFYIVEGCNPVAKSTATFSKDMVQFQMQVTIQEETEQTNDSRVPDLITMFGCAELRKLSRPSAVINQLRFLASESAIHVYNLTAPWCMYYWLNYAGFGNNVSLREFESCSPKSCWIQEYCDINASPPSKWASFYNFGKRMIQIQDQHMNFAKLTPLEDGPAVQTTPVMDRMNACNADHIVLTALQQNALEATWILYVGLSDFEEWLGNEGNWNFMAHDEDSVTHVCCICRRILSFFAISVEDNSHYFCLLHAENVGEHCNRWTSLPAVKYELLRQLLEKCRPVDIKPYVEDRSLSATTVRGPICYRARTWLTERELLDELNLIVPNEFHLQHKTRTRRGKRSNEAGFTSVSDFLQEAKKGDQYFTFNLMARDQSSRFLQIVQSLRMQGEQSFHSSLHVDQESTLVLLGYPNGEAKKLQGTAFHLDRLCATNVGFAIDVGGRINIEEPIAVWYFVFLEDWQEVQEVSKRMGIDLNKDIIPVERARILADSVGLSQSGMFPKLRIQYQFTGQVFHVTAGVYHSVVNIRPNVKLAFDFVDIRHLCTYAKLLREQFADNVKVDDFGCVEGIIREVLKQFVG